MNIAKQTTMRAIQRRRSPESVVDAARLAMPLLVAGAVPGDWIVMISGLS
jgi:hypothetical protein